MAFSHGPEPVRAAHRRAQQQQNRRAHGCGQMHRPAIVGNQKLQPRCHRSDLLERQSIQHQRRSGKHRAHPPGHCSFLWSQKHDDTGAVIWSERKFDATLTADHLGWACDQIRNLKGLLDTTGFGELAADIDDDDLAAVVPQVRTALAYCDGARERIGRRLLTPEGEAQARAERLADPV